MVEPTHLKNINQNGSFLQVGVKIKHIWNHHLVMFALFCFDIWYLVTWPIFYIIKQLKKRYRYCTSAHPRHLEMYGNCWSVNIVTFTKNSRLTAFSLLTFDIMEPTRIRILPSRPHKSIYHPFASLWQTLLNHIFEQIKVCKQRTRIQATANKIKTKYRVLLLMEEILHHLGWLKPCKWWDNHHPWWWQDFVHQQ